MDHNMTMNSESLAPFVINLPYGQYSREAFEKAFDESLEKQWGAVLMIPIWNISCCDMCWHIQRFMSCIQERPIAIR